MREVEEPTQIVGTEAVLCSGRPGLARIQTEDIRCRTLCEFVYLCVCVQWHVCAKGGVPGLPTLGATGVLF